MLLSQSTLVAVPLPVTPTSNSKPAQIWFCKFRCCTKDSTHRNFPFKLPLQFPNANWNFNHITPDVVKKGVDSFLSRTHDIVNEMASPLFKTGKPDARGDVEHYDIEGMLVGEQTISSQMPDGNLSLAAIVSIEQFSRTVLDCELYANTMDLRTKIGRHRGVYVPSVRLLLLNKTRQHILRYGTNEEN